MNDPQKEWQAVDDADYGDDEWSGADKGDEDL
jgi:hypothetical protein